MSIAHTIKHYMITLLTYSRAFVSDIAIFVLTRDVKLQLTNYSRAYVAA